MAGKHAKPDAPADVELVGLDKNDPRIVLRNSHGFYNPSPVLVDAALVWWHDHRTLGLPFLKGRLEGLGISTDGVTSVIELLIMAVDAQII
jgi:hypothetical protein